MTDRPFYVKTFFHCLLIVIVGFLAYSNTFHVPFQFDDEDFILQNPLLRDFSLLIDPSALKTDGLSSNIIFTRYSRTLSFITFWLNYKINGLNVAGYHIVNLMIHLINAMLVYALVSLTFKTPSMIESRLSGKNRYIALFSALIFVSHPVQTEAVTYITQRFASLCALLYLAAVVCYARWRMAGQEKPGLRAFWYALSFMAALMATKTKENAFTLPLAIAMYEFVFFRGPAGKRIYPLLPFIMTMLVIPLSRLNLSSPLHDLNRASRTHWTSRTDYLYTEFSVIVTYLRLLFFPVSQNLDYDYPFRTSFLSPGVFIPFLFLAVLFIASVYLLRRSFTGEKGLRVISFGVFWFFLTLSMESSIIPLFHVIFEYRVYLPSVGIIAAFVSFLFLAASRAGTAISFRVVVCFCTTATLLFAVASHARNEVWQSDLSLWSDVVSKSPGKARDHYNLGLIYAKRGKLDEGIDHLQTAVRLKPDYFEAHNNLGVSFINKGRLEEAEEHLTIALKLKPDYAEAYNNLGILYEMKGSFDDAVKEYQSAIELNHDFVMAHLGLGAVYKKKGLNTKSEEHLRIAQELISKQRLGE